MVPESMLEKFVEQKSLKWKRKGEIDSEGSNKKDDKLTCAKWGKMWKTVIRTMLSEGTSGSTLDRVHNSRRPGYLIAFNVFLHCDHVTLTSDLNLISWQGLMMNYPYVKFGDCSFSHFGFVVWIDRQTESHRRCWTPYSCDSDRHE